MKGLEIELHMYGFVAPLQRHRGNSEEKECSFQQLLLKNQNIYIKMETQGLPYTMYKI